MRTVWRIFAVSVPVLLFIFPCVAFAAGYEDTPLLGVFPQLRNMPAPSWLREGVRLTYYSSAASIPDARYLYFRDEEGGWVDQQGNRYRRDETSGSGGHGYTEVDVVGMDESGVALSVRSLGITGISGPVRVIDVVSSVGLPAATGDWWLSPAFLETMLDGRNGEWRTLRMPYTIGETTYRAIRFQYETEGARHAYVYDLDSGVLVYSGSAVNGRLTGAFTQELGQGTSGILSQSYLIRFRQRELPWMGDAAPGWIGSVRSMRFEGSLSVTVPGSPTFSLPFSMTGQIGDRGSRWFRYRMMESLASIGGMPPTERQAVRVSGLAQVGGIWMPPQALARLQPGSMIDEDPVTGVRVEVSTANGGYVAIAEKGSGFAAEYVYDQEYGLLRQIRFQDPTLYQYMEVNQTDVQ